jgi:hypothetical protein
MTTDARTRWLELMRRIPEDDGPRIRADLDDLQQDLQAELFGGRPLIGNDYDLATDDERVRILLDALDALSLLQPSDPSYSWDRGLVLEVLGRHLEAAPAYLDAASRFDADAHRSDAITGDEADWAATARYLAAKSLLRGGQAASAAALLPRLESEERKEIETLLADASAA